MDDFHLVLMSRAGSDHSRLSESARKLSLPLFFSQTSKTHARNPSESKKKKKDRYLPLPARVVFFPTARFERRCGAGCCGPKVEAVQGLLSRVEVALGCGFFGRSSNRGRRRQRCRSGGGVAVVVSRSSVRLHSAFCSAKSSHL